MADLTSRQRQHLKKLAHHLNPVVHVGKDGISDSLRKQVDQALDRHELIKVKLAESAPLDRDATSEQLPTAVGAFLVQNIGRVFILYRPHPEKPRIELPWATQPDADEEMEDDESADIRAPRPRAGESLLRSVRERGPSSSGSAISSQRPVPPPRPVFAEPDAVPVPKGGARAAEGDAAPAPSGPRGTPKGGGRAKARPTSSQKKRKPVPKNNRGTRGSKRKT